MVVVAHHHRIIVRRRRRRRGEKRTSLSFYGGRRKGAAQKAARERSGGTSSGATRRRHDDDDECARWWCGARFDIPSGAFFFSQTLNFQQFRSKKVAYVVKKDVLNTTNAISIRDKNKRSYMEEEEEDKRAREGGCYLVVVRENISSKERVGSSRRGTVLMRG